jgi:hypothetical protein
MNKKVLERNTAALLFVLVLVVFSFAERDSKKLQRLYTTSQLLKKKPAFLSEVASRPHPAKFSNN